ncbi:MAG: hypothetical protein ACRDTD_15255, partial [Pseudonocardiaceae bacterium]
CRTATARQVLATDPAMRRKCCLTPTGRSNRSRWVLEDTLDEEHRVGCQRRRLTDADPEEISRGIAAGP